MVSKGKQQGKQASYKKKYAITMLSTIFALINDSFVRYLKDEILM